MNRNGSELTKHMSVAEEIDLASMVLSLWKRKLMILLVVAGFTCAAIVACYVLPKIYAVSAIVEPAKDVEGQFFKSSLSTREMIVGGVFNQSLSDKTDLPVDAIAKIQARVLAKTDLIEISVEDARPKEYVNLLNELFRMIAEDINDQLEFERKHIQNGIASSQSEVIALEGRIASIEKQLATLQQNINDMRATKGKSISENSIDEMAFALYANEIASQEQSYYALQDHLSDLQRQKADAVMQVANLELQMEKLRGITIIKPPTVSDKPVKPRKVLIMALAVLSGMMFAVFVVYASILIDKVRYTVNLKESK